jgi:hypothetical protein
MCKGFGVYWRSFEAVERLEENRSGLLMNTAGALTCWKQPDAANNGVSTVRVLSFNLGRIVCL